MLDEIRFALRQLRKSPAFSCLAILTLAIGIGMNTAMFSLIHDLFLRGLPFSDPNRVVRIYGEAKERDLKQLPFSVPKFWHFRDGQTVFSSVAADWSNGYILTGLGEPVQVLGGNVTANYFDLLGRRFSVEAFHSTARQLRLWVFCLICRFRGLDATPKSSSRSHSKIPTQQKSVSCAGTVSCAALGD